MTEQASIIRVYIPAAAEDTAAAVGEITVAVFAKVSAVAKLPLLLLLTYCCCCCKIAAVVKLLLLLTYCCCCC